LSAFPNSCPQCGDDQLITPAGHRRGDAGCTLKLRHCGQCAYTWGQCEDPYCGNHTGPAPKRLPGERPIG